MLDARNELACTIELRRTDNAPRYRVDHRSDVIGWATSLKIATQRLHRRIISEGVPCGGINGQ